MSDRLTFRAIVALCAILGACVYGSSRELRYVFRGHPANATLIEAVEELVVKREGSMPFPRLRVTYEFDDAGRTRTETDSVNPDFAINTKSAVVPIEYLPGTTTSRLKGNNDKGWLWGSAGFVLLAVVCTLVWWKFKDAGKLGT